MNLNEVSLSKATIRTDQLLNNIKKIKNNLDKSTKFMAVVKANAYSHGAVPLARKMEAAGAVDYFGVAQLKEALELRAAKLQTPILIFNSVRAGEIELAMHNNITLTVFTPEAAMAIVETAERLKQTAKVHIKIDSGMARLGIFEFEDALAVYQALTSPFVTVEGIYTHFADAKEASAENFTHEQFSHFKGIIDNFEEAGVHFTIRHCCNTAATLNFPEYHLDMVRVGLGLYGLNPAQGNELGGALEPIQTVRAMITYVKDFPAHKSVGYGRSFVSEKPMRIATVAIGYADGVAKSLSNKGFFTYKGNKLPILGEVCMDQTMIDCSEVEGLSIGDYLTYFGTPADGDLLMTNVAKTAGASQYDLLCRMGTRVERIYE